MTWPRRRLTAAPTRRPTAIGIDDRPPHPLTPSPPTRLSLRHLRPQIPVQLPRYLHMLHHGHGRTEDTTVDNYL